MDAKAVIRADAVFEVALGIVLLVGAAADGLAFPHPVGRVAVAVCGGTLVLLGAVLWRAPLGPAPLAAGNVVTAVAGVAWLAAANGFSPAAAAFVGAAVSGLVALAAAELALARTR